MVTRSNKLQPSLDLPLTKGPTMSISDAAKASHVPASVVKALNEAEFTSMHKLAKAYEKNFGSLCADGCLTVATRLQQSRPLPIAIKSVSSVTLDLLESTAMAAHTTFQAAHATQTAHPHHTAHAHGTYTPSSYNYGGMSDTAAPVGRYTSPIESHTAHNAYTPSAYTYGSLSDTAAPLGPYTSPIKSGSTYPQEGAYATADRQRTVTPTRTTAASSSSSYNSGNQGNAYSHAHGTGTWRTAGYRLDPGSARAYYSTSGQGNLAFHTSGNRPDAGNASAHAYSSGHGGSTSYHNPGNRINPGLPSTCISSHNSASTSLSQATWTQTTDPSFYRLNG
ncbi:unnamed protein product [Tilletia caries]|nr:unnamed protein product [Tilletia caries]CAD6941613.1 unnamed protein product [Tilletia caries]